jgi:hypothetical protein
MHNRTELGTRSFVVKRSQSLQAIDTDIK